MKLYENSNMKLYIDTGNIDEIEKALSLKLIDGITTNPSLILKEGKNFKDLLKKIDSLLKKYAVSKDFTVSAEVTASDSKGMFSQGKELASLSKFIIVKVPLNEEGLLAVRLLSAKGIRTNVTLCFSVNQALLAAKAGAFIVSPFVGRLNDIGQGGMQLLEDIKKVYTYYGFKTQILGASIRDTKQVSDASLLGIDIVTVPSKVLFSLMSHELTTKGIEKFNQDWESYLKQI